MKAGYKGPGHHENSSSVPVHFFPVGGWESLKGTVHITVACNIGNAHMPESTAVLTFWM